MRVTPVDDRPSPLLSGKEESGKDPGAATSSTTCSSCPAMSASTCSSTCSGTCTPSSSSTTSDTCVESSMSGSVTCPSSGASLSSSSSSSSSAATCAATWTSKSAPSTCAIQDASTSVAVAAAAAASSSTWYPWCLCEKAVAHLPATWTGGQITCSGCGKTVAKASAVVDSSGTGLAARFLAFLGWHRFPHFWSWSWPWPWPGTRDDPESGGDDEDPSVPVLLVPGIGGTMLFAEDADGKSERVWVRLFGADHEFREKLWSKFDVDTGKTMSLDPETKIVIPEDRDGLFCCDILDPAIHIRLDAVYYFHDLIREMKSWGYVEGHTLFGFGYDFRQSNRLPEALDRLTVKLKYISKQAGGRKVNVITHSMGGLLFKSFLATRKKDFERYVNSWIAVTCPFGGAPGFVMDTLLTGVEFVKGWGRSLFIQKWSFHQLAMECPSIYEMMSPQNFEWKSEPLLKVWEQVTEGEDKCLTDQKSKLKVYPPKQFEKFLREALADNVLNTEDKCVPLPLNSNILRFAHKTRQLWDHAKLPEGFRFFNIVGTSFDTPFNLTYGTEKEPIKKLSDVLRLEVEFGNVDGDGTVPVESAMADGLKALKRVQMKGDHRGILNEPDLFSQIKDFLNPAYDPEVDAVLVPPAAEVEEQIEKEHWRLPSPPLLPVQDFNPEKEDYNESIWAGAMTIAASSVTMTVEKVPATEGKDTAGTAMGPQKEMLAENVAGDMNRHSALVSHMAKSKDTVRMTMEPHKETPTEKVADDINRHSPLVSKTCNNLSGLSVMTALPEVSISAGLGAAVRGANTDSMVIATS